LVDFVIPSNDDASKSISKILNYVTGAIVEGLAERKSTKDKVQAEKEAAVAAKEKAVNDVKEEVKEVEK